MTLEVIMSVGLKKQWDRGRHTLSNNTLGFVEVSVIAYDLGSDHECGVEETVAAGTTCGDKP